MRLKLAVLAVALAASALPASAQAYYRDPTCQRLRQENQTAGLILGGILGGVLGSNVAARGHRSDGTALGAVVGGLAGSAIGGGSDCRAAQYGNYPTAGYPVNTYPDLAGAPVYDSYPQPDYYPPTDSYDPYDDRARGDQKPRYKEERRLAARDRYSYRDNDDYAGRECDSAVRITRLPDGSEIREPVEACRDRYYGDWRVRD